MALTRNANGELVEDTSIMGRLQKLGVNQTAVTSPLGAANVGASPDAVKMARAPNRMQSVLTAAASPTPTLGQAQRTAQYDQQMPTQTIQQQQAAAKAQQLKQVGGTLANTVQVKANKILNDAALAQQGQLIINDAEFSKTLGFADPKIATADPRYAQAKALFQTVMTQPQNQQAFVDFQNYLTQNGLQGSFTDAASAKEQLTTNAAAAGQTAAGATQNQLQVKDLNPADLGYDSIESLASAIGFDPDELSAMTVPELQAKISDLQKQQFAEEAKLKAKIVSAPIGSAQRLIYERQLRQLQSGGTAVTEQKAAESAGQIALADTVKIGDKEFSVEDVLKDTEVSKRIEAYMNAHTDEERNKILPPEVFGELRGWVDQNELALLDATGKLGESQTSFQQAQRDVDTLGSWDFLGEDKAQGLAPKFDTDTLHAILGNEFDPDKLVTADQVAAFQAKMKATPFAELMKDAKNSTILDKISADDMAVLKKSDGSWQDPETIKEQAEAGSMLNDPGLNSFMQMGKQDFVPADKVELVKENKDLYTTVKNDSTKTDWLADKDFLTTSLANKTSLVKKPALYTNWKTAQDWTKKATNWTDDNNVVSDVIPGQSVGSLTGTYNTLVKQAAAGNRAAQGQLKQFKDIFGGSGQPNIQHIRDVAAAMNGSSGASGADEAVANKYEKFINELGTYKSTPTTVGYNSVVTGGPNTERGSPPISAREVYETVVGVSNGQPLTQDNFFQLVDKFEKLPGMNRVQAIALVADETGGADRAADFPKEFNAMMELDERTKAKKEYAAYVERQNAASVAKAAADKEAAASKAKADAEAKAVRENEIRAAADKRKADEAEKEKKQQQSLARGAAAGTLGVFGTGYEAGKANEGSINTTVDTVKKARKKVFGI